MIPKKKNKKIRIWPNERCQSCPNGCVVRFSNRIYSIDFSFFFWIFVKKQQISKWTNKQLTKKISTVIIINHNNLIQYAECNFVFLSKIYDRYLWVPSWHGALFWFLIHRYISTIFTLNAMLRTLLLDVFDYFCCVQLECSQRHKICLTIR